MQDDWVVESPIADNCMKAMYSNALMDLGMGGRLNSDARYQGFSLGERVSAHVMYEIIGGDVTIHLLPYIEMYGDLVILCVVVRDTLQQEASRCSMQHTWVRS